MIVSKRSLAAILLLLLGAYALRLYRLDAQSLWWDEGISLHLATSSAAEIVRDRLANIHPPLYFFVLKGWVRLAGVSPFAGRYLSVLAGLLQVALACAAAGYWSRHAGPGRRQTCLAMVLAAGLMLLSPLSVIYSQEIRVYALLPVVYLALLLLAARWLSLRPASWRRLALLMALAWFSLHLHYIALIAVAYVGLWGVLALRRRDDRPMLRRWLLAHLLLGVASLPWLLAVFANWPAVQAEAAAGTFATEPVPLPFLLAQVWVFHLTGLAGSLSSEPVRALALIAAAALGGALVATMSDRERSRRRAVVPAVTWRTAAHWGVPLLAGLLVWSVRSFSHPRYIIIFAAVLIPLVALLAATVRGWLRQVLAVTLAACLVILSLYGLRQYFFDSGTAKPDVRGAARYLETVVAPEDLVLVPDTDWSLPFEYHGVAPVLMPAVAESPHDAGAALARALDCPAGPPCARSGRVYILDYLRGTRDWQSRLPFELARRGHRAETTGFGEVVIREYRLADRAGPLPTCDAPGVFRPAARFGPLVLTGAWIAPGPASDTAVAVALCWRADGTPAPGSVASLVLRDPLTGERLAQVDTPLRDESGAPASLWTPGSEVVTFHVLPLSPGTPPLPAALALGVYEEGAAVELLEAQDASGAPLGRLLPLGEVELAAPVGLAESRYGIAGPVLLSRPTAAVDGLRLLGLRVPPGPFRPGQTIRVGLTWQSVGEMGDAQPSVALVVGDTTVAENADAPAQGRYPTERWTVGEIVTEVRDLRVPAEAVGEADLVVRIGGERLAAAPVTIGGAAAQFDPPATAVDSAALFGDAIRLVGFDPPPPAADPSRPVPVTLYWQAATGSIATSYAVFVHLLDEDGRIIAQHDGPPAGGARPTDGWMAGEYVADAHELAWRETDYRGPARLVVGLYDPLTGVRLATAEGDQFQLPFIVKVGPSP